MSTLLRLAALALAFGPCGNLQGWGIGCDVMRVLLALMAVLALAVSPVTAAAAQVACNPAGAFVGSVMDMPGMSGMEQPSAPQSSTDPCCDHGGSHKMDAKSCALACAMSCASAAVLPSTVPFSELAFSAAQLTPIHSASPRAYEPSRHRRPPRSMA
jgi:hypothetical protein